MTQKKGHRKAKDGTPATNGQANVAPTPNAAEATEESSARADDADAASPPTATGEEAASFPVVGIGASAGGLAAFEAFFSGMPADADSGMAFVLVQHLAPDHKSILTELVKRYTRMAVFEVEDGMRVRPNCAYIIPPNRDMAFLNGALQLLEPVAPRGQRLPIDFFFRSLAQDQRERAICIVLSGSGSDGTRGLRAVKAEGGMAMAQNPDSTEYDAMPRSAIGTGLVDYTLPPAEMPEQLIAYVSRAFQPGERRPSKPPPPEAATALTKIFILLRAQTGHDFSQYKPNTIHRRVERRMAVHQIERSDGYLRYLQGNPAEIEALFRDLLIGVTQFFRDAEAFAALERSLTPLLASKPAGSTIRVWVPGCSSGEEALSICILLREQLDAASSSFKLQVFASDIDSRAIDAARTGLYPASIATDVSPERLERYFSQDEGCYRIRKDIRDALVFSVHDVIKDPPFSKLDLISCRNLLIYMGPELQRKLIPLFHYALNPHGLLFLGSSETVGDFTDLFALQDRKGKVYQRTEDVEGAPRLAVGMIMPRSTEAAGGPRSTRKASRDAAEFALRTLTEQVLLERGPVAALVNEHGELLYLHGQTGKYLEPAPGAAGLNILKMARQGLRQVLPSALHRAAAHKERVYHSKLRIKTNGEFTTVNLVVQPAPPSAAVAGDERLFLITFEDVPGGDGGSAPTAGAALDATAASDPASTPPASSAELRITQLQQEVIAKDERLQAAQEEMQTSNEELRSSNEELQSTNEELQSTNEELETSKEELQSVNEELATVNSELSVKVIDLSRANSDMNNLLAGTGVGTIFVDHELHVQRFTPAAALLVNLIRTDVGRPLAHIVSNFIGYDGLVSDVQGVLDTLVAKEVEVKIRSGHWFLLRIRPYRTLENVVEGAVITFTEVTELKNAQARLRESDVLRRMAAEVRDAHDAVTVQGLDGQILSWNRGAVRMYGWSEEEALTMNIRRLVPEAGQEEALAVVRQLTKAVVLAPFHMQRVTKDARIVEVSLTAGALVNELGDVYAVSTTERAREGPPHV